jgi:N-acetylornithine carbamoyltransferase
LNGGSLTLTTGTELTGRDFIDTQEWSRGELEATLELAAWLKRERREGVAHTLLRDKTLFMLFFFSSTRTRNSFEAGMTQLGGHAVFVDSETTQIAHGDTPKEIGRILGSYGEAIAIRACDWQVGNRYIRDVAEHSPVPVLNMQCDLFHPCQALADLMTIREHKGEDLRGRKVVMSWAYAKSYTKPLSVPQSVILLMTQFGMDVTLAHPPGFGLTPEALSAAQANAAATGGRFEVSNDMDEAFRGADVVYPKAWGGMMTTTDPDESLRMSAQHTDWICDERRMALAKPDAIYMHCLPADRGLEVTSGVIDGPQSVIYDEAENRLHAQKALLALTMGGVSSQV